NYDDAESYKQFLKSLFGNDPRLAAAWDHIGNPPRGGSGWQRVKEAMKRDDLPVDDYAVGSKKLADLIKRVAGKAVNTGETLVYKYFEEGPNVGIHHVTISGPHELYPDRERSRRTRQRKQLIGDLATNDDDDLLRAFLSRQLPLIFRRPIERGELDTYFNLVRKEQASTGSLDDGLHLALRTSMISPAFIYRGANSFGGPGPESDTTKSLSTDPRNELSAVALANRLSFFLTSGPPDSKLRKLAQGGRLGESQLLRNEAERILDENFVEDFTNQWLGLSTLDSLMPDTRLIRKFSSAHRDGMREEVGATFKYVLDNDLPVTDLIAPEFVFTNSAVGWDILRLPEFRPPSSKASQKKKSARSSNELRMVAVPRDGHHGGLLTMPAVMMATANGVDTQPVLRGVWVLNNILGTPPPDPPNSVPALTPDTSGTLTPKSRLAAHMQSEQCSICHQEIDPLGFVLESFDPVGRWRDQYPRFNAPKNKKKIAVDPSGQLPDGTELADVTDLKRWLLESPTPFARCLSEKLMTYATGRQLNYRERAVIKNIVAEQHNQGLRLKSLLLALVDSEIFRTP
ncbi:MAG: DUF1588 domain-containing protein, partial [Planctomycetota bacterium]